MSEHVILVLHSISINIDTSSVLGDTRRNSNKRGSTWIPSEMSQAIYKILISSRSVINKKSHLDSDDWRSPF